MLAPPWACFLQGFAPHLQGSVLWDAVPRPAKNPFEKGFLDLPKLLEMGIINPRPSGEVAAQLVALTERVLCATPLRRTPPPPRRLCRLPSKTTPLLTRASTARRGIIFLACPSDKVGGGNDFCKRGRGVACSSRSNAYRNRHLKHKPSGLHEQ